MEIKIHVSESELEHCEFQMLEIWDFAISAFLKIIKSCQFVALFPMFPGKKGDGGVGRPLVLCHSTQDLEFTDSSSICSEDPDLEKLTNIYLRICVCPTL